MEGLVQGEYLDIIDGSNGNNQAEANLPFDIIRNMNMMGISKPQNKVEPDLRKTGANPNLRKTGNKVEQSNLKKSKREESPEKMNKTNTRLMEEKDL
jgi:hypothetical protein